MADSKSGTAAAAAPVATASKDTKDTKAVAAPIEVLTGLKKDMDEVLSQLYKASEVYTGDMTAKQKQLEDLVKKVVALADGAEKDAAKLASEGVSVARLWFWKGRAYDVFGAYHEKAEFWLQKAVKSEPDMIEAWNALANTYWKKKDMAQAHSCLMSALGKKKNKQSLCHLSMVLRALPGKDEKEHNAHITESVTRAKEALALDGKDGKSWYTLGNALLSQYFNLNGSSTDVLSGALKAYRQAEVSEMNSAASNPDLHYNRASVYKFYEDYQESIDGYRKAASLDPQLPAAKHIEEMTRFVSKLSKLVASRGGFKQKKLTQLVASIPSDEKIVTVDKLDRKRLPITELKTGINALTACVTKVLAPISRDSDTPVSFLLADAASTVCVVSLYNVTSDVLNGIKPNDTLTILEPNLKLIAVKPLAATGGDAKATPPADADSLSYKCIHITNPFHFLVNGKRLHTSGMAAPRLASELLQ